MAKEKDALRGVLSVFTGMMAGLVLDPEQGQSTQSWSSSGGYSALATMAFT